MKIFIHKYFVIITTPLDLPLVKPNDWNAWWSIWQANKAVMEKVKKNHNAAQSNWYGLDLYKKSGMVTNYAAPAAPLEPVILDLVDQVMAWPMDIDCIRIIENLEHIRLHSDHNFHYHSVRSLLWSDYSKHPWYLEYQGEKRNIKMPEETNTFYYLDGPVKHASRYEEGRTKGLLVVFGKFQKEMEDLVSASGEKYKDYAWVA